MKETPRGLSAALRALDPCVLTPEERKRWASMVADDARRRIRAANRRDAEAWAGIRSRAGWERFRDARIADLRRSLGVFPDPPEKLDVQVARTLDGDGFRIQNLAFASRPGFVVTANLYLPEPPRPKMPAFLICHSHHNPKTQGELQDMGVNWARTGAMVLVMDQVGHGERRQQPFGGRQDYRSRFYTGMQLHLVGESLIGWMAWDMMRGVDVLLSRPGVDPERIIAVGSVAGGGDPVAVLVALDPRITCSVPFNFGGPQPETPYPLPPGVEQTFNYAGGGSFESTRNLRLSARDGFLPWVLVAAAAPRPLIYAHEFSWHEERDPVWARFQRIYGLYGAADKLAAMHGWGRVTLRPPDASHCNNVGPAHRERIYPLLERWLGIPAPEKEVRQRRDAEELACLTDEARERLGPKPVHQLAKALSMERAGAARAALATMRSEERREKLRRDWGRLLGTVEPAADPKVEARERRETGGVAIERLLLTVEEGITVPVLLLRPGGDGRAPVAVGVAEGGKAVFLKHRADELAALLGRGVAVCLPDLRATGETDPDGDPGRHKKTTSPSSSYLMVGETFVGSRLRDLRAVLRFLRTRRDLDAGRLALWGDSIAPVNTAPFDDHPEADNVWPPEARPLGGLMALFGALFEEGVRAVLVRRGLVAFESVLCSHFCYVPHDTIIPEALTAGDLCDIAAALAPIPLRLEGLVTGRNCEVTAPELRRWLEPTRQAYAGRPDRLTLHPRIAADAAPWLASALVT